jgi:FAD/FMN-containing dehydrogenase
VRPGNGEEVAAVLRACAAAGVAKRAWLGLTRSEEEIAAMRAIKRALDPAGVLNPGAVL